MYPELHHELGRGGGAERGAELGHPRFPKV